ncbi:MAG: leucine-rich repeat domain-containing protein, partial [Candidatus Odinarchaeia archaeon]
MVDKKQLDVIKKLEKFAGRNLEKTSSINWDTAGYKVEGEDITALGLYNCGLTTLPESIGNLKSLQKLYLNRNQLTTLPESILNLTSLQLLN